jgi:hypothetical protein
MSRPSFEKLLSLIEPHYTLDKKKSRNSTGGGGPIEPVHALHCTIRYLAGGIPFENSDLVNISESSFHRIFWKTIEIINDIPELDFNLPFPPSSNPDRIRELNSTFQNIQTSDAFKGCIGALDGWLCRIECPSKKEEPNQNSFFSGHYQCFGINVQAMCDGNCQFTYVNIASPGGNNDILAYRRSKISYNFVDKLGDLETEFDEKYYIVADNAYPLSSNLLVPFRRSHIEDIPNIGQHQMTYNFYLSQNRIRIEMAFGMLVNKFRIFKRESQHSIKNTSSIIQACMKLHNFCIRCRLEASGETDVTKTVDPDDSYLINPDNPTRDYEPSFNTVLPPNRNLGSTFTYLRDAICKYIKDNGLKRPGIPLILGEVSDNEDDENENQINEVDEEQFF